MEPSPSLRARFGPFVLDLGSGELRRLPGGHDLLAGQNPAPGERRIRRATIFDRNQEPANLSISAEWVIPTGGGYFFVPSIPAIKRHLASG